VHSNVLKQLSKYDYGNGKVKSDVFFNVLEDNKIIFGAKEEIQARIDHCEGDLVRYKDAVRCFWYDKDA
jgi:hypothetical protein